MDIDHYTNFRELVGSIDPKLIAPFLLGVFYGGLVMTGVWRRWLWLLVILLLLPVALYVAGFLLPVGLNVTYRLFFLGAVTLAVLGLAYYLSARS